jgi:hypothetical protein
VRDGPEEVARAIALAAKEDIVTHVVVVTGDGELPSLKEASAFAAALRGTSVTVRKVAPQPGSELMPEPPRDFAPLEEDHDLRVSLGYGVRDARFWREGMRALLGRRAQVCAGASLEECAR